MITVYHGTDQRLESLAKGSFVTRSRKDAWRFGYRRTVRNGNVAVYVYSAEIEEHLLEIDPNRDRAYMTKEETAVKLTASASVWNSPYKLRKFELAVKKKDGVGTGNGAPITE